MLQYYKQGLISPLVKPAGRSTLIFLVLQLKQLRCFSDTTSPIYIPCPWLTDVYDIRNLAEQLFWSIVQLYMILRPSYSVNVKAGGPLWDWHHCPCVMVSTTSPSSDTTMTCHWYHVVIWHRIIPKDCDGPTIIMCYHGQWVRTMTTIHYFWPTRVIIIHDCQCAIRAIGLTGVQLITPCLQGKTRRSTFEPLCDPLPSISRDTSGEEYLRNKGSVLMKKKKKIYNHKSCLSSNEREIRLHDLHKTLP